LINQDNFLQHIDSAYQQIARLPAAEIKYYLFLLVTAIKEKNDIKNQTFLGELLNLIADLQRLYVMSAQDAHNAESLDKLFNKIWSHFIQLGTIAETHNFTEKVKNHLLNAAGVVLSLAFGVVGGVIGGIAGFVRGVWLLKPLTGFLVGLGMGILMGGMLGFRCPKKLFKNEMQRQIKFGLDGVDRCMETMQKEVSSASFFSAKEKPFSVYLKEVEEEIKALFSDENEFKHFLDSEVEYVINSLVATFIGDPMLEGYVGHHSYIKINIKDAQYLIEFAPEPSDLSKARSQTEKRVVTGRALIDMLAYHRKLQETHTCDNHYILSKAKPGDTDCFSYVNKVLIGTNQKATMLKRFHDMSLVGRIFGNVVEQLSPFKPDFFHEKKATVVLNDEPSVGCNCSPTL
jgi:uncharacterized membrane protein